MTTSKPQWIELRLKEGEKLSDQTVKINTLFAMNSHLPEQGYTLELYLPKSSKRDQVNVAYLKSDHEDFLKNCCGILETSFYIKKLPSEIVPPKSFILSQGLGFPQVSSAV